MKKMTQIDKNDLINSNEKYICLLEKKKEKIIPLITEKFYHCNSNI